MNLRLTIALIVVLLAEINTAAIWAQKAREAVSLDGRRFEATLAGFKDSWQPLWQESADEQAAPTFLSWGQFTDQDRNMWVLLRRGSILAAEVLRIDAEQLVVDSPLFGRVNLPKAGVRGVVWRLPVNPLERDRMALELLTQARAKDQVWLANGDQLSGSVSAGQDGSETSPAGFGEIQVASGTFPLVVPLENVVAVGFEGPATAFDDKEPPRYALWGWRNGSRLAIARQEQQANQIRLFLWDDVELPCREGWEKTLVAIQALGRDVGYLSDVPDLAYKQIPFLSTAWELGRNRNLLGGMLRVGGRIYPKGLAMHSTSRVAVSLDRRYKSLVADLAIDDAAQGRGSVVFRVFAERLEGEMQLSDWKVAYESPILRGGQRPLPIVVDITGAQRLALVVDFADRGDEGDHADWLNVRLVP